MSNRSTAGRTITSMKPMAPMALVVCGVVLGLMGGQMLTPQGAQAQTETINPESIMNSGAQRKQMIDKLSAIDARMAKIEAKLSAPLQVKVLEMPAMKSEK